jgi:hypothetical protein
MTESSESGDLSYLEQEAVEWNESDPPFSYFVADDWSTVGDSFIYEDPLESSPGSLILDPAAHSTAGASYELTDPYVKASTNDEDGAVDTPGLEIHDGASDVTSTIVSTTEGEHAPVTGRGDSPYMHTSCGKAFRVAK